MNACETRPFRKSKDAHDSNTVADVSIRPANIEDIASIALIHLRAFPGFFLTKLGAKFLAELYRCFVTESGGLALVAECDDKLIGFAVGSTSPKQFFKSLLLRRGVFFLWAALPALVKSPLTIGRKLAAALFYRGESPRVDGNATLLSSLAVSPHSTNRGAGKALVRAYCHAAAQQNAQLVYLTTDSLNNEKVNSFYKRLGFRCEFQFVTADKRKKNYYVAPVEAIS